MFTVKLDSCCFEKLSSSHDYSSSRTVTLSLLIFDVSLLAFTDGSELYAEVMLLDAFLLFINKAVCLDNSVIFQGDLE